MKTRSHTPFCNLLCFPLNLPTRVIILSVGVAVLLEQEVLAQAATFTNGGPLNYSENFDSMTAAGTYAPGWTAVRGSGNGTVGDTLVPAFGDGSGSSGNAYSVGVAGTNAITDRAFGSLGSGTTVPFFGTSFVNSTQMNVGTIAFGGFAEQWRTGNDPVIERLAFEYSFSADSLLTGSWAPLPSFDVVEIQTSAILNAAVDGNAAANRLSISGNANVSWETGTSMWIRWRDTNDGGNDALLAIDDFTLTVTLAPPSKTLTWTPTPQTGANWNTASQNWNDGTSAKSFATGDSVNFTDTALAAGSTVTIVNGGVSPNRVNVSNTSGTYTFTGGPLNSLGTLTKTGAGALVLSTTFGGSSVVINGGTIRTTESELLNPASNVSVGGGGTLDLDGNVETLAGISLTGGTVSGASIDLEGNLSALASATPSTYSGGALVLVGTNRTISAAAGAVLNINAPVSGTGGTGGTGASRINLAGPGTIRFNQGSDYTNGFTMPSGATALRVILGNRGAFGSGGLRFNGGTIEGGVAFTGVNAIPTPVSIGGNVALVGQAMEFSGQISIFNNATTPNRTITIDETVTFSGPVVLTTFTSQGVVMGSPNDRLVKAGAGALILSSPGNTYDDGTIVTDGTLRVLSGSTLGVGKDDHSSNVFVTANSERSVVLEIQHNSAIDDLLGVALTSNGTNRGQISLNFGADLSETIYALTVDGEAKAPGIYNSVNLPNYLTGTGSLNVLTDTLVMIPEPSAFASLLIGAASMLGLRPRRRSITA